MPSLSFGLKPALLSAAASWRARAAGRRGGERGGSGRAGERGVRRRRSGGRRPAGWAAAPGRIVLCTGPRSSQRPRTQGSHAGCCCRLLARLLWQCRGAHAGQAQHTNQLDPAPVALPCVSLKVMNSYGPAGRATQAGKQATMVGGAGECHVTPGERASRGSWQAAGFAGWCPGHTTGLHPPAVPSSRMGRHPRHLRPAQAAVCRQSQCSS